MTLYSFSTRHLKSLQPFAKIITDLAEWPDLAGRFELHNEAVWAAATLVLLFPNSIDVPILTETSLFNSPHFYSVHCFGKKKTMDQAVLEEASSFFYSRKVGDLTKCLVENKALYNQRLRIIPVYVEPTDLQSPYKLVEKFADVFLF